MPKKNKKETKRKTSEKQENKKESTLQKSSRKAPKFNIKKILLFAVPVVLVVGGLTALYFIKPEVRISSLETERISLPDIINSESKYPKFKFKKSHKVSFAKDMSGYGSSYQSKKNDYVEGKNKIKYCRSIDLFFLYLSSSKCSTKTIEVDRVAPKLEVLNYDERFHLLEDFNFTVKTEEGATIFVNDVELGTTEADQSDFSFKPYTGENSLLITSQDSFGNSSEPVEVEFNAFNEGGYERKECSVLAYPLSAELQLGFSDSDLMSPACNKENEISVSFLTKGFALPCEACGFYLHYIEISSQSTSLDQAIEDLTKDEPEYDGGYFRKVIDDKEYTTKSGIVGRMLTVDFEDDFMGMVGNHRATTFVFERNGVVFEIDVETKYGRPLEEDAKAYQHFMPIVDNVTFI